MKFSPCLSVLVLFAFGENLASAATPIMAHRGVYQTFSKENLGPQTCTAERIDKPTHSFLENTVASMAEAFRLGADWVEIDVHATVDGGVVVFHDWELECRTNGQGVTEKQSLAYLQSLDIGYGYTFDNHQTHPFRCRQKEKGYRDCLRRNRMPSLAEVLTRFSERKFVINLKSGSKRALKIILSELKRIEKEHGYDLSQIIFFCSQQPIRDQARKEIPKMLVPKLNWQGVRKCIKNYFSSGQFDSQCREATLAVPYPDFKKLSSVTAKKLIADIHHIGGQFWVVRVNSKQALQYLLPFKLDAIWTEKIEVLAELALPDDIASIFSEFEGCFLLKDLDSGRLLSHNPSLCQVRHQPCSTFKILNSLIGRETGVIENQNTLFRWNGKAMPIKSWQRDHTLASAIQYSVVWYYQELARRVGLPAMRRLVKQSRYGNSDIGKDVTRFWLDGPLAISADEQILFLEDLYLNRLPFSPRSTKIVKEILILDRQNGRVLSGKTGSGYKNGKYFLGWFVGHLLKGERRFLFATVITASDQANGYRARMITEEILPAIGL